MHILVIVCFAIIACQSALAQTAPPQMTVKEQLEILAAIFNAAIEKPERSPDRRLALERFLRGSRFVLPKNPGDTRLWLLHGIAALELDAESEGRLAGRYLIGLNEFTKADSQVFDVLAALHTKGWLEPALDSPSEQIKALGVLFVRGSSLPEQAPERRQFLTQFIEKSGAFLKVSPKERRLWLLRAVAALELGRELEGREAGHQLTQLRIEQKDDPKTGVILDALAAKGWLKESSKKSDSTVRPSARR